MARKIFVNLPIANLQRSVEFFTRLGFTFNPKFTDEKATCMIISEEAFVMLLVDSFFKTFTKNEVCDKTHTETLIALSCESRAEVDDLMNKAIAGGGRPAMPAQDLGFMYQSSFYDLDGHHWELAWMNPEAMQ